MTNTPNLNLLLLSYNQVQKELVANEALIAIDALLNNCVIAINLNEPPLEPKLGDAYIIGAKPKGAWDGKAGYLTYFYNGWRFIRPKSGLQLWVQSLNGFLLFSEGAWRNYLFQSHYLSGNAVFEINISAGRSQYQLDINKDCEIKLEAGKVNIDEVRIIINQTGSFNITWPSNVKFVNEMRLNKPGVYVLSLARLKSDGSWVVF